MLHVRGLHKSGQHPEDFWGYAIALLSPGTQRFTSCTRHGKFRVPSARQLGQHFIRSISPQPSKHQQKLMLSNQMGFDIRELPLGAACRWGILTFCIESVKSNIPFPVKENLSQSQCWVFSLNKTASIQLAKGQGPPTEWALIYDYVHKLKLWMIQGRHVAISLWGL